MLNILIAEDNADMRELFCTALSDSEYKTFPASDDTLDIKGAEFMVTLLL